MNADGSNQYRLTNHEAYDSSPCWSPNETKIAFDSSGRDGPLRDIYTINADGTNLINLTQSQATSDFHPDWSPDGTKILFGSNETGNGDIYVMNADGTNRTRLTTHESNEGNPVWSPDGKRIAFSRYPTSHERYVYIMDADGTNQQELTSSLAYSVHPSWSPDGTKIAFEGRTEAYNYEIMVINADGTGLTNLTNNLFTDSIPSWSPDGTKIAFSSRREDGDYEIYVMNADGTDQIQLTNNDADDWDNSWQKTIIKYLDCVGFEPPMDNGPVTAKKNRAFPFKAQLFDGDIAVTDSDISALPVIQVIYDSGTVGEDPVDVTDDALPVGQGTEGNQFVYTDEGKWQFNLKTTNYTAPGMYSVTIESGEENEYVISPTCECDFVIK